MLANLGSENSFFYLHIQVKKAPENAQNSSFAFHGLFQNSVVLCDFLTICSTTIYRDSLKMLISLLVSIFSCLQNQFLYLLFLPPSLGSQGDQ